MPRSSSFRLLTERLEIRLLGRADVTTFTHYRNTPSVARYQDWPLPYTRDLAHQLVDALDLLRGPADGGWTQLALRTDDALIGDLAVWLDDDGDLAMVGYTLSPEHQGHGFAVEALTAVVDWLFTRKRVHRIAATIDPRNLASARVLERCGFEYIGTARSAAHVRGEWTDDARFSLLPDDWRSWRDRPTGAPAEVRLVEVVSDNLRRVLEIAPSFSQDELVAPVAHSLSQAAVPPVVREDVVQPWFRAIEADGEPAGFIMAADPHEGSPHPYLWRLVIDHRHQGRGIGRRAVLDYAHSRRAAGDTHLRVSYVAGVVASPEPFYRGLGFEPTGEVHDGETEAMLDLTKLSPRGDD